MVRDSSMLSRCGEPVSSLTQLVRDHLGSRSFPLLKSTLDSELTCSPSSAADPRRVADRPIHRGCRRCRGAWWLHHRRVPPTSLVYRARCSTGRVVSVRLLRVPKPILPAECVLPADSPRHWFSSPLARSSPVSSPWLIEARYSLGEYTARSGDTGAQRVAPSVSATGVRCRRGRQPTRLPVRTGPPG